MHLEVLLKLTWKKIDKMSKSIIKFNNFSYIYPDTDKIVLDKINIEIKEGDFIGIIGGNKAGKSTLCQAMVGVLPYVMGGDWDGHIEVNGINLDDTKGAGASDTIGIIFQDAESQFTQETVEDEIAFAMCNFGYERSVMKERVISSSNSAGLKGMLDRSPLKLSGGQQQRLAIASILALEPQVIVLDESTSQLDPIGRDEVFTLVANLHAKGHTVIMVDHNVEKIAEYANKVIVLNEGRVEYYDTPKKVFKNKEKLTEYNVRIPQVTEAYIQYCKQEKDDSPITLEEAIESFKGVNYE